MSFIGEFGGKLPNGFFRRNQFHECGEDFDKAFNAFRKENQNKDIYICAYKYKQDMDNVADIKTAPLMSDVYFDFDIDNMDSSKAYGNLKASVLCMIGYLYKSIGIKHNQMRIYFSGSKGFHVVIPAEIFALEPDVDLNLKIEKFVEFCMEASGAKYIDLGIYDRRRLFRVPGTINSKSGLYKVPVTTTQIAMFSHDDMINWASEQRDNPDEWAEPIKNIKAIVEWEKIQAYEKPKVTEGAFKRDPNKQYPLLPCAQAILESGVQTGQRNVAGVALASSLFQSNSLNKDEVLALMHDWNESNDPPMNPVEVNAIVRSAEAMNEKGMLYGCSSFRRIGFCVDSCRFNVDND